MMLKRVLLTSAFIFLSHVTGGHCNRLFILLLDQQTEYHTRASEFWLNHVHLEKQLLPTREWSASLENVLSIQRDFANIHGAWAVWPCMNSLLSRFPGDFDFLLICEEDTQIRLAPLLELVETLNATEHIFMGHGLRDEQSTIIHHFAFAGADPSSFLYPDFSGGVLLSLATVQMIVELAKNAKNVRDFTIDPKHELAMLLWQDGSSGGVAMQNSGRFCTLHSGPDCVAFYEETHLCPHHESLLPLRDWNVFYAVKTFHEFHKSRVVVVKRTWAKDAVNIEFYSDTEDLYIPTYTFPDVPNTERGHCGKTFAILRRFMELSVESELGTMDRDLRWLVILDDDTLISVIRLMDLIKCYDPYESMIVGERYGFGFDAEGRGGYSYPTGGSGMIFSRSAVIALLTNCECPSPDAPDDMIIGSCAGHANIPIVHAPQLHQARPPDYARDFLAKTRSVSFHKHWEIDPYQVYADFLEEPEVSAPAETETTGDSEPPREEL